MVTSIGAVMSSQSFFKHEKLPFQATSYLLFYVASDAADAAVAVDKEHYIKPCDHCDMKVNDIALVATGCSEF